MNRYIKTIVALIGSLATWGIAAAEDNAYSQVELWGAVLALATAAGVYALPNKPPAGERSDPGISEQDAGAIGVGEAVVIGILVLLVLLIAGVV